MAIKTCHLTGYITDSAGVAVGGSLEVTANGDIFDDSTVPDTLVLKGVPRTFTIPSTGLVDIDLPVSEPSQVSYTFKLTPTTGGFKQWEVSIPDVDEVEFNSVIDTPFTTDRAVTGGLYIARLMGTDPVVLPYVLKGLGIIKQSTTPAAPDPVSVIWFNTSNGLWYTWDTTAEKWVSEVRMLLPGQLDISASTAFHNPIPGLIGSSSAVVTHVIFRYNVQASPNDGTNRWSLQAGYRQASSTTPVNIGVAQVTDQVGYTTGTVKELILTPNTALNLTTAEFVRLGVTKVGSPGNLNVSATFVIKFYAD